MIEADKDALDLAALALLYGVANVYVTKYVDLLDNRVNEISVECGDRVDEIIDNDDDVECDNAYLDVSSDEDFQGDDESDSVISGGASTDEDEEWIASRNMVVEMKKAREDGTYIFDQEDDMGTHMVVDSDDEYLNTPPESDDDGVMRDNEKDKVAYKVDSDANLTTMVWKVGMRFCSPEIFKQQVSMYGALAGYCIRWYQSQKNQKLGAKCREGCGWKLYASWAGNRDYFVVKRVISTHTCDRQDFQNMQVTPRFLAKEYMHKFHINPSWPRTELHNEVLIKFGKRISRHACYTVKKYAHQALYGSVAEHYNKIGSYIAELKRVDPLTNVILLKECGDGISRGPDVFKRLYVSFPALRDGFSRGCRPVICLDGCFLKTFMGGMLLCAIGRDGNNQMFPIAWAVVEAENNDSWSWFLEVLKNDLPAFGGGNCTISSDQQKGLCNAVNEHFPNLEHRNCARHIYANWHKKHKGDELKYLFWRAARAYTKTDYEAALVDMGKVSKTAVEDFIKKDPKYFCRSHLKTGSKTEVIVNNMAETFNGCIVQARLKPLMEMFESIRLQVMERFYNKSLLMKNKKAEDVCPRIKLKLDQEKLEARHCNPIRGSEYEFQVTHRMDMFSVNTKENTCSCRKWDLTGIPCCHVISCLNIMRIDPEKYVTHWMKKEKYQESYKGSIKSISGKRHWPAADLPLHPPPIKIRSGRPKKNRKMDGHERFEKKGKLSRQGMQMTCKRCGGKNHNKRACTQPPRELLSAPQNPKPRGRPRKDGAPPQPRVVDPTQLKRKRGRPVKVVNKDYTSTIPKGMGAYFGPNASTYINPGQQGAYVILQSGGKPGPSQFS